METSPVGIPARLRWVASASVIETPPATSIVYGIPSASAHSTSSSEIRGWMIVPRRIVGPLPSCLVKKFGKKAAVSAAKRRTRKLWGEAKGNFRTVGRYSSAAVRGTTWNTADQCAGTLTKVTSGKVGVRDFVLKKTVVVKAGHKYLAGPTR